MCLSIPAKVIAIEGTLAKVSVGGAIVNTSLHLVDNIQIGDYVLIHSGFALNKISEAEALETISLLDDLEKAAQE